MDLNDFFQNSEPSFIVMSESRRAHYGRRPRAVELFVPMCCPKCEEKVRESLLGLEGVQGVNVDPRTQRVTVTGLVDPARTLKKMRKVKKNSQFFSSYRESSHGSNYLANFTSQDRSEYRSGSSMSQLAPVAMSGYHVEHRPAKGMYDQAGYQSLNWHRQRYVARDVYEEVDRRAITNPCYYKHIESEYWPHH